MTEADNPEAVSGDPEASESAAPGPRRTVVSVRPESTRLPVVPLPDWVAYPELTMPLQASRPASVEALAAAADRGDAVVVVTQRRARKTVDPQQLCTVGTAAKVIRRLRMPDGGVQVLLEGQYRASVDDITPVGEHFEARVTPLPVEYRPSLELEALRRVVVAHVKRWRKRPTCSRPRRWP